MKTQKRKSVRKVTKSKITKKKVTKKKRPVVKKSVGKKVSEKKVPIKEKTLKGKSELKSIADNINSICGLLVSMDIRIEKLTTYFNTQKLVPQGNTREVTENVASLENTIANDEGPLFDNAPATENKMDVKQGSLFDLPQETLDKEVVEITLDQVRQKLQELNNLKGLKPVSEILTSFGYNRMSDIQEGDFQAILNKANEWLK